jgi:argininosuccinate lyase
MYRSRPSGNLDNKALSFLSSLDEDAELFYYDILGSQAHVIMLYEVGILAKKELIDILKGMNQLLTHSDLLNRYGDSASEDIHELVESAIIRITDINSGGKMHTARSRNDQVILDIRMKLRDDLNRISANIILLIKSLLLQANNNVDSIMPMYTHLQQAQLGVFSHYLLSYCFSLTRDFERFTESYKRINCSPLGACAIGGSSMNINREKVSSMLGFSDIIYNSIDATSSRDSLLEFASASLICMLNLCKIAEDFIIWSTSEFGFVLLNDQFSSSSSVMPQKKNPDPLELIRGKTGVIQGILVSISTIMKGLPSGYSRDLQEIKPLLWKITSILEDSISIMVDVISTMSIDKNKMYVDSSKSYAISLDIAEQLIKNGGISFRESHKLIGIIVDYAVKKGNIPLNLLKLSDISEALGLINSSNPDLTAEKIQSIIQSLTPENSIEYRTTKGSPNKNEQKEMISDITTKVNDYEKILEERSNRLTIAKDKLNSKIKEFIDESS